MSKNFGRRKYSWYDSSELGRYDPARRSRLRLWLWFLSSLLVSYSIIVVVPYSQDTIYRLKTTLTALKPVKATLVLYTGEAARAELELVPDTAVTELYWSIDDERVAVVQSEGSLTGLSAGETTLSATASNGIVSSISVIVIDKPLPPGSKLPEHYSETIQIANVQNPLPSDYKPELVNIPEKYHTSIKYMKVTPETLDAFERMFADARAATGRELYILSAYRSYSRQVQLFEEDVQAYRSRGYSDAEARRLTGLSTQLPGCSEHQLGNSMDLGSDFQIDYSFGSTRVGSWVTKHAHEYGFVLRYPKDKTGITGISYEAWHFRWVGVEHAEYIYEHGLCLEEYVQLQAQARQAVEEYSSSVSAEQYLEEVKKENS